MNTTKALKAIAVSAACLGASSAALAGISLDHAPHYLPTLFQFDGAAGIPATPSNWFVGDAGASQYTYWAGDALTFSANLPPSSSGWMFGVAAMNVGGPLPSGYPKFDVDVAVNGASVGTLRITASDTQWHTAWIDLGNRSGPVGVTLTWQNDAWNPGVSDANISYGAAAFAGRSLPTPGTGLLLLSGLGILAVRSRRKA